MAIEYKLPYTGEEVGRRLAQVDVLAQDIIDLGEAVEGQLTDLSDGFAAVIQQMYGEDWPENDGDPVTIREIAETAVPTKVSELTNDSGYITSYTETDPTVPAWAKASTKPSYTKSEVGLGNVDNVKQYSASNPPPYPVTKVNNKTGAVTLSASDVGADASGAASSAVSAHNTNTSAHADIRAQISQLSSEKVDKIEVAAMVATEVEDEKGNIVQAIIAELQGLPVFGVVDESKKITLTSQLAAGNYSMGYNNADGTYTEICIFTVGSGVVEPEGPVAIPLSWLYGKKSTYTAGATYTLSDANNYSASELIPIDVNKTYVSTISKHSYSATNLSYRVIYLDASNMVISSQTLSLISEAVSSLNVPDGCSNLALRVFSTDAYTDEEICATITLTKE